MTEEERFVDFATVRTMLLEAEKRRKNLTYEQKAALQHAEWAASDARNGFKTDPEVFQQLKMLWAKLRLYPRCHTWLQN